MLGPYTHATDPAQSVWCFLILQKGGMTPWATRQTAAAALRSTRRPPAAAQGPSHTVPKSRGGAPPQSYLPRSEPTATNDADDPHHRQPRTAMSHPCSDHPCDHCYQCDGLGVCCASTPQHHGRACCHRHDIAQRHQRPEQRPAGPERPHPPTGWPHDVAACPDRTGRPEHAAFSPSADSVTTHPGAARRTRPANHSPSRTEGDHTCHFPRSGVTLAPP